MINRIPNRQLRRQKVPFLALLFAAGDLRHTKRKEKGNKCMPRGQVLSFAPRLQLELMTTGRK